MKRIKLFIEKFIYTENPAKSFARLSPMDESENGIETFTCFASLLGAETMDKWDNPITLKSFSLYLTSLASCLSQVRWMKVELVEKKQVQAMAAMDKNRATPACCEPFNVGNADNPTCNSDYDFVGVSKSLVQSFESISKVEKEKVQRELVQV